jgi:hypothetical protein
MVGLSVTPDGQIWEQLPDRRRKHGLSMLYKILNKIVDVDDSDILRPNDRRTRGQQTLFLFVYHMIKFVTFLAIVRFSMSIIGKIIQQLYKI